MAYVLTKLEYALFLAELLEQLEDEELALKAGLQIGYDEGAAPPSLPYFVCPVK